MGINASHPVEIVVADDTTLWSILAQPPRALRAEAGGECKTTGLLASLGQVMFLALTSRSTKSTAICKKREVLRPTSSKAAISFLLLGEKTNRTPMGHQQAWLWCRAPRLNFLEGL